MDEESLEDSVSHLTSRLVISNDDVETSESETRSDLLIDHEKESSPEACGTDHYAMHEPCRTDHYGTHDACELKFYPPVYQQRYIKVRSVLDDLLNELEVEAAATVVEFGCAELRLHQHLKGLNPRLQKLIYIDKDEITLQYAKQKVRPLCFEYLMKRETPLHVEIYSGCVTMCDPRVYNVTPSIFAVIGIELIEHLDPDVLLGFERTVFGLLGPPIVILTTPNADFNPAFNLWPGLFRHYDHRFEWSRQEFGQWCTNICMTYPGYSYEVSGIGSGPPETASLGCVSQMAVFKRNLSLPRDITKYNDIMIPNCYNNLAHEEYPFFVDTTPRNERIVLGFKTYVNEHILNIHDVQSRRENGETEARINIDIAFNLSSLPSDIKDLDEVREALVGNGDFNVEWNEATGKWELVIPIPENDEQFWAEFEEYEYKNEFEETMDDKSVTLQNVNYEDEEWM